MNAQHKTFRIETFKLPKIGKDNANGNIPEVDGNAASRHDEIMAAIRHLQSIVDPEEQVSAKIVEDYKAQRGEARKLKTELDSIHEAIASTKKEIATLHVNGFNDAEATRVTDELDAIVIGTEKATESILSAAEEIDQFASSLAGLIKDPSAEGLAGDIQDSVIKIFEACNFQDLTGQRISKVVGAMHFIEQRIERMMEIWGGMESFRDVVPDAKAPREGDAALLNGPALAGAIDVANQDDIDALFN